MDPAVRSERTNVKHHKCDGEFRVAFCWTEISGYMASCWRALASRPGISLHVFAYGDAKETAFSHSLMSGLNWTALPAIQRENARLITYHVTDFSPDVVVLPGWFSKAYMSLVHRPELGSAGFIMGMDTNWGGSLRQKLAPYVLRRYLSHISAAVVAGERSYQYARRLGFPEQRIRRFLYGVDYETLSEGYFEKQGGAWPRSFLYVGRYCSEKGIDILLEAYRRYRKCVSDPWPLICCGMGPQAGLLENEPGVENRGFVQPGRLRDVMRESGVFVLPSLHEPWGVALVEACAGGLPVIATNACGAAIDCLRDGFNGRVIATGDAESLAGAMQWAHEAYLDIPVMGRRSMELAAPFSASSWASQWEMTIRDVAKPRRAKPFAGHPDVLPEAAEVAV